MSFDQNGCFYFCGCLCFCPRPVGFYGCSQVADSRKADMLKHTSLEYVEELAEDLLKWYAASNRGMLRCVSPHKPWKAFAPSVPTGARHAP